MLIDSSDHFVIVETDLGRFRIFQNGTIEMWIDNSRWVDIKISMQNNDLQRLRFRLTFW